MGKNAMIGMGRCLTHGMGVNGCSRVHAVGIDSGPCMCLRCDSTSGRVGRRLSRRPDCPTSCGRCHDERTSRRARRATLDVLDVDVVEDIGMSVRLGDDVGGMVGCLRDRVIADRGASMG